MPIGSYEDPAFDPRSEAIALHDEIGALLPRLPREDFGVDGEFGFATFAGDCWADKSEQIVADGLKEVVSVELELFAAWAGLWRSKRGILRPIIVGESVLGNVAANTLQSVNYFLMIPERITVLTLPHTIGAYNDPSVVSGRTFASLRYRLRESDFSHKNDQQPTQAKVREWLNRAFMVAFDIASDGTGS